jgi:LmbE family N-acetylglucosaminyl deacetylase
MRKAVSKEGLMENQIKTLLVSPHSDDIAFSIGGTVLQNIFVKPLLLVTIFSISDYSPCAKISTPEKITKIRRLEDIKFAEKIKIEFQSLDFSEPVLRGYSRKDIFANNNPFSDPIYKDVYFTLSNLIKLYHLEMIVAPLGLGNHIDHIIASNICRRIAKENNIRIVFYEDLHYASRLTLKQIKVITNSISPDLQPRKIDITNVFNDKIENIKLYKTQTFRIYPIMIKYHALRLGIENKNLTELIVSYNLLKFLLFFVTNKYTQFQLYERLWLNDGEGEDEHSANST